MKRTALIVALVLGITAACSSGGSNKAASTSSSSSESSPSSSSSSSNGAVGASAADCAAASAALESAGDIGSNGSGKLKDDALKARDSFRALQSAVSDSDTKAALGTMADAYNDFANAVGDTNYDPSTGETPPAAVVAAIQAFAKPEFGAATAKLSQFFATGCHS